MKRYLLVWACGEAGHPEEEAPDGSGGGVFFHDVQPPIPCEDRTEVGIAIRTVEAHARSVQAEADWSLFEAVDGAWARRAITFAPGGLAIAEIS